MAIIKLNGYFFTGADADKEVDAHHALTLVQNESTVLELSVFYMGTIPYDLTGKSLTLTVKRKSYDTTARLTKTAVLVPKEGVHRANFSLTPLDLKLIPQRYVYDIWLTNGAARNPVVRLSALHLEPSARI